MRLKTHHLWGLAALGWILHSTFTYARPMALHEMDQFYLTLIGNMRRGLGMTLDGIHPGAYFGPLFIMTAAAFQFLFGDNPERLKWLQFLCDIVAFWFTIWTARRVFGFRAAAWTALILAWYPGYWNFDLQVRVENFMTALISISVLALSFTLEAPDNWPDFLSGISVGATCLTKAVGVPAVPAIMWCSWRQHRRKAAVIFAVGWAAMMLPWIGRNAVRFHRFIPSQGGVWPELVWASSSGCSSGVPIDPHISPSWRTLVGAPTESDLYDVNNDAAFRRMAIESIRAHPFTYLFGIPRRFCTLWIGNSYYLLGDIQQDILERGILAPVLGFVKRLLVVPLLLMLAARTIIRLKFGPKAMIFLYFPFAFSISYSLTYVEAGRFQLPVLPSIIVLASASIAEFEGNAQLSKAESA